MRLVQLRLCAGRQPKRHGAPVHELYGILHIAISILPLSPTSGLLDFPSFRLATMKRILWGGVRLRADAIVR